ncbi:hypothetical protein M2243_002973 [Heliophilum fasciatum]|nr:hypothetical protein [Heliophilum fasciatum]
MSMCQKHSTYDDIRHFHIGFYYEEINFEAVAFNLIDTCEWHLYFSFDDYGLVVPEECIHSPRDEYYGYFIFSIITQKPENDLKLAFENWGMLYLGINVYSSSPVK